MRRGIAPALLCIALAGSPCVAQTLQDELRGAGIPTSSFAPSELSAHVNAARGQRDPSSYLVFVRIGADNLILRPPEIVRFNTKTGALHRADLDPGPNIDCCGSPLGLVFTTSYVLASFHSNPSAGVILAIDSDLKVAGVLQGFGPQELSPDTVIFTENMVHFTAQHQERLAYANLRTGEQSELFPSKNDPLRAAFAALHQQHMPPPQECANANDPCDPGTYDETLRFLGTTRDGFRIWVDRSGAHPWAIKDPNTLVPYQSAVYVFQRNANGWLYCEAVQEPARLVKWKQDTVAGQGFDGPECEPKLPIVAETPGVFSPKSLEER